MKRWLELIVISVIVNGLLISYSQADYSTPVIKVTSFWSFYYYLWDDVKDVLLTLLVASQLSPVNPANFAFKAFGIFFSTRCVWHIVAYIYGLNINARYCVMISLIIFIIVCIIVSSIAITKRKWAK